MTQNILKKSKKVYDQKTPQKCMYIKSYIYHFKETFMLSLIITLFLQLGEPLDPLPGFVVGFIKTSPNGQINKNHVPHILSGVDFTLSSNTESFSLQVSPRSLLRHLRRDTSKI